MKSPKQYRLRNFLFLSLMIHLIIAQVGGHLFINPKKDETAIRVKFIELKEEKKENLNWIKGEILDIPKPVKIEKPTTQNILSEFDSKAHSNESAVKKDQYQSSKTASPQSKSKPKRVVRKKTAPKKEIVRKTKNELKRKSKKKMVIAKKVLEKESLKETENTPMVLEGLFKQRENQEKDEDKNQNPLFKGFDLEKFAKLDTREKEGESDTETVSLDSQELKYASYFSTIKRQIELVWSYPEQAATRGLQGKLLLQFILDRSGKLIDISLINSSGHKILDNAALGAVKTASPYNPFPEKIQKRKLRIIASFKYKPFYTSYQ